MDLLTVKEAGELWGITARMATIYCETGRIPGAFKKGNLWLIPGDAIKPFDRRKEVLGLRANNTVVSGIPMQDFLRLHGT